ncbi:MAG: DUF374 domain-containing protein [Rhodobacteraceae bacterium]|nr:DUF374 domain-containing protein [Paracoccaceae bacterium]
MSLAARMRDSVLLERAAALLLGAWLRLCHATTRWQGEGLESLRKACAEGPVIVLLWHSRTVIGAHTLPLDAASFAVLHDPAPAGRLAGATVARIGVRPMRIAATDAPTAVLRRVLSEMKAGTSLIVTGDGPDGPAHVLRGPPLDWIRVAGCPVFLFAVSVARQRRLSSWDRLLFPLPFTRGAFVYRRWTGAVPRRPTAEQASAARSALSAALMQVTADCDAMIGLPPGP